MKEAAASSGSRRRTVLSEEQYNHTLGSIIREQYFPDVDDLERQVAVLERRSVGDFEGAVAVRRAARRLQAHQEALQDMEREQENDTDEHGLRKVPRPLHRETVTGFHERVISEDNAEFERVQKKEQHQRIQQRNELLRLTNGPTANPLLTVSQPRHHPLLDTPLPLASDLCNPQAASFAIHDASIENSFFFVPSARRAVPQDNDGGARLLMPPPSSSSSSLAVQSTVSKQALVEYIPKKQKGKIIDPSATRFPAKQQLVLAQKQHLEETTDEESSLYESSTDASTTDLDEPGRPLSVERQMAQQKRKRELETFVQMTPLIEPNASPLMTWGSVEATPVALDIPQQYHNVQPIQTFHVPEANKRDQAAEQARARLEERARKSRSASSRASSLGKKSKAGALTPAAMSLFNKSGAGSARSGSSFGTALRASYSLSRPSTSGSRVHGSSLRDHVHNATPKTVALSKAPVSVKKGSITDNLLRLPH